MGALGGLNTVQARLCVDEVPTLARQRAGSWNPVTYIFKNAANGPALEEAGARDDTRYKISISVKGVSLPTPFRL